MYENECSSLAQDQLIFSTKRSKYQSAVRAGCLISFQLPVWSETRPGLGTATGLFPTSLHEEQNDDKENLIKSIHSSSTLEAITSDEDNE